MCEHRNSASVAVPYKLPMRDPTGVYERVFNGDDTRYPLPSRGVPDELCGPFDFYVFRVVSWPRDGLRDASPI